MPPAKRTFSGSRRLFVRRSYSGTNPAVASGDSRELGAAASCYAAARMSNRCIWVALRLVAGALAIAARLPITGAREAAAAEIPASAATQSLSMPPILSDDVALIYEFPSRAPLEKTQAFALGVTDYSSLSSGNAALGLLRSGSRSAFYLITQPLTFPADDRPASPMFHAGFGTRLGAIRVGACVRHLKDQASSTQQSGGTSYSESLINHSSDENLELGFGVGAGASDRNSVDASLDLVKRRRTGESDRFDNQETVFPYIIQTSESHYRLIVDGPLRPEAALRVTLGDGGSRFLLAGRWAESSPEVTFFRLDSIDTLQTEEKSYARRWLVAAAGERDHGARRTVLYASAERDDAPPVIFGSSRFDVETTTTKVFTAGLSHRRPILPHLTLLLGLQGQIQSNEVHTDHKTSNTTFPDGTDATTLPEFNYTQTTQDTKRFSWGLAYSRDRLQVNGAASATLHLDAPFAVVDARFFF